jgi:hypothetical protein
MTLIARSLDLLAVCALLIEPSLGYNILMATMGGTKSHTVPFVGLGTSLRSRGHNVTLLSAFSGPAANNGLHELVPPILEVIYDLPRVSLALLPSVKTARSIETAMDRNGARLSVIPFNSI